MSIIKITPDLIEQVTLTTHPKRTFVSSSQKSLQEIESPRIPGGRAPPTGSIGQVNLMPRANTVIKSVRAFDPESTTYNEDQSSLLINLRAAVEATAAGEVDIQDYLGVASANQDWSSGHGIDESNPPAKGYMEGVRKAKRPIKNSKAFSITRFRPPFLYENTGFYAASPRNKWIVPQVAASSFEGKLRSVKDQVRNILLPANRARMKNPDYAYTNYHSLNFFTASINQQASSIEAGHSVMLSSVLIYPSMTGAYETSPTHFTGRYAPKGAFTFDFYINPRYTNDLSKGFKTNGHFQAGTIYHMSSTFAVSLVTGSSTAANGTADGYRILLQLSQSADFAPSKFLLTASSDIPIYNGDLSRYKKDPYDYAFLSADNSLKRNHWHHVAIRWSPKVNGGTGSFVIDGEVSSEFSITGSESIVPEVSSSTGRSAAFASRNLADPDALFIGNFYEGANVSGSASAGSNISRFFNTKASSIEGFTDPGHGLIEPVQSKDMGRLDPAGFAFNHPLNAEVHDLKIYNSYRTLTQIYTSSIGGPEDFTDLLFYLPPFYINERRERTFLVNAVTGAYKSYFSDTGGGSGEYSVSYPISNFIDPFVTMPFNAGLAMTVDSTLINLDTFTKDLVNNIYPRLLFLTASSACDKGDSNQTDVQLNLSSGVSSRRVSEYLFNTASLRKRCLTVLPCDNGRFNPNYSLVYTGSETLPNSGSDAYLYTNDLGEIDKSLISLKNMFSITPSSIFNVRPTADLTELLSYYTSSGGGLSYASPDRPNGNIPEGTADNKFLAYQASLDPSSNEIVLFNIPNMFYGNRIQPGSVTLSDDNLSGSGGKIKITLKDDGQGSLYRADSATSAAVSNCVGNIFYDEGIILIKSPHLAHFGKDQFEISFNGEQNLHVMSINVPCRPGLINSSSNPGFKVLSASLSSNDYDSEFVYITGIYFHDDNMNVIMKANLAQPVVKRDGDSMVFRAKMDF